MVAWWRDIQRWRALLFLSHVIVWIRIWWYPRMMAHPVYNPFAQLKSAFLVRIPFHAVQSWHTKSMHVSRSGAIHAKDDDLTIGRIDFMMGTKRKGIYNRHNEWCFGRAIGVQIQDLRAIWLACRLWWQDRFHIGTRTSVNDGVRHYKWLSRGSLFGSGDIQLVLSGVSDKISSGSLGKGFGV